MPVYKYIRKKKWFSYIGPGNPGDFVQAIYRGTDEDDVEDPLLGPNGGELCHRCSGFAQRLGL